MLTSILIKYKEYSVRILNILLKYSYRPIQAINETLDKCISANFHNFCNYLIFKYFEKPYSTDIDIFIPTNRKEEKESKIIIKPRPMM